MTTTAPQQPPTKAQLDKAIADAVRLGNVARAEELITQLGCDPDVRIGGSPLLAVAVKFKTTDMLRMLLDHGAAVDAVNAEGDTALMLATRANKGDFVRLLLDNGAALLQQNNTGDRAADIALRGTQESRRKENTQNRDDRKKYQEEVAKWGEVLQAFVKHKDFDPTTGCDNKPYINFAVEASTPGVVASLLGRGADIESTTKDGDSPLLQAAKECREDFATLLLAAGANVNATNNTGENAVSILLKKSADMLAQEPDMYSFELKDHRPETKRRETLAALLINQPAFDAKGARDGEPYITLAAAGSGTAAVEALLARGADVNTQDAKGDTPLLKAARAGNREMAEFLLQNGAEPHHANVAGETLESIVLKRLGDLLNGQRIKGFDEEKAKRKDFAHQALEKSGYNLEASSGGMTLLGLSARLYEPELMDSLLKKGANVNGQFESGPTPLMVAAQGCRQEFTATLLAAGARLDIATKAGDTAIGIAMKGTVDFIDQLAKPDDVDNHHKDTKAQMARWEKLIETLTAGNGYDYNAKGGGKPLVALAARFNSTATLVSLLEAGATADAPADNGDTALMVATRHCHPDHAQLLLDKGASAYARNATGETARKIAVDAEDAHLQTRPGSGTTWEEHEATRKKWDRLVDMLSSEQENVAAALIAPPTESVAVRNKPLKIKMKTPAS